MKSELQFYLLDRVSNTAKPMLLCPDPAFIPNVGDTTLGPDGKLFVIVQREFSFVNLLAFATDKPEQKQVISCAIVPVSEELPGKPIDIKKVYS